MDDPYKATVVAMRQDLISNLKSRWSSAERVDDGTVDKLADSIADVLLELSPDTDANATLAIYADAKSIAAEVVACGGNRRRIVDAGQHQAT